MRRYNHYPLEKFMTNTPASNTSRTIWLLTAGAFYAFFVFGFTDNLKGPTLPAILQDLNFSYSLGGTILLGMYLGFMAATISTGLIADRVGQRFVLILAGICLALGVGGFSSFSSPLFLSISTVFLGFGLGSLELGCNALIVSLHSADKGRYLNLMAVMHGMGSMFAPLYAGWLLAAETSWRSVYRWDFILIGLLIAIFVFVRFPKTDLQTDGKIDFRQLGKTAFTPEMMWYYAAIAVYVAIELGIASWIVEFLQKIRAQSITQSTQALSLFFGLIMVGRFVGSFLVERLGYLKSILIAVLGASACVALAVFGPPQFSIFLPISGFFLSIIFPTITAAVSESHTENLNSILGLLFTFAGLGGILGPWLVGIASDMLGLKIGFAVNLLFGLMTAGAILVLLRMQRKVT
jgi:FHS family glucose/mannose:H+ symporter-like MFS transporter